MLRNYLAATLRGLARDRLHAAITTLSLAIGFAAVILATVFARYEENYDRFWPQAQRIFVIGQWTESARGWLILNDAASTRLAPLIRGGVPEAEAVARMDAASLVLERGQTKGSDETIYWADANLFQVLQPKVVAGSLTGALEAPGSIVLTRSLAQKYFGDADAVGQTLLGYRGQEPAPRTLRVTAVIEDLPPNSHLTGEGFAAASTVGGFAEGPAPTGAIEQAITSQSHTYVLARPGADRARLEASLKAVASTHFASDSAKTTFKAFPLTGIYLKDPSDSPSGAHMSNGGVREGNREYISQLRLIAGLILAVGAINFITLMTARGARRAVEVAVRKASGARRRDLIAQFLGEALLYALLAFLIALAMAELASPLIRAMTGATAKIAYPGDFALLGRLLLAGLAVGVAAGIYPAIVLSSYRPAAVLKGGPVRTAGSARLRQALISLQFVPLILLALLASMLTISLLKGAAASQRVLPGNPLMITAPCTPGFKTAILALDGVRSTACMNTQAWQGMNATNLVLVGRPGMGSAVSTRGEEVDINPTRVSAAGLAFHEIKLLAGRMPTEQDEASNGAAVLLNQDALRKLGFSDPAAAIGRPVTWSEGDPPGPRKTATVMGVLANRGDVSGFETVVYIPTPLPPVPGVGVGVRFEEGADRAAILAGVDRLWREMGNPRPLDRFFYEDEVAERNADQWRLLRFVFACLGVGMLVGAMGLFGVSAFLAERRTKEIGVRKAMGAARGQVVGLMIGQFALPVVVACVLACPLGWALMSYLMRDRPPEARPPTGPDVIAPVVIGAVLIALLSTFLHAWRAASAKPVHALRYE